MQPDLRAAWESMRHKPCFQRWPEDFDLVMQDPIASRLVRLAATFMCRKSLQRPIPSPPPLALPAATAAPAFDRKRAAAGDRDD